MKALLGAVALVFAAGSAFACDGVVAEGGFVRPLMGQHKMTAAYVTLKNTSDEAVTITGVSTPVGNGELHESVQEEGVMKMRHLHHVTVPAKGEEMLKPGGKHIMIMNVNTALPLGSKVDFALACEKGKALTFSLPVEKR